VFAAIRFKRFGEVLTPRESVAGRFGECAGKGLVEVGQLRFDITWPWR
jgi:hypothetical protein